MQCNMTKIQVDPKLFVICRLCLEDTGTYQIVPNVQEKIQFCFGISVEPFDGLSQLICKSCDAVLSNYAEVKQKFIDQQKILKLKTLGNKTSIENSDRITIPNARLYSESSRENDKCLVTSSSSQVDTTANEQRLTRSVSEKWKKHYSKKFNCTLCAGVFKTKISFKFHNLQKHNTFKMKYGKELKQCRVDLPRVGEEHNLTGSYKHVVISPDKIIEYCNADYIITYYKTSSNNNQTSSSDSDESVMMRNKTKRRRIISCSSTDTVLLDNKGRSKESKETPTDDKSEDEPTELDNSQDDLDNVIPVCLTSHKYAIPDSAIMKIIDNCGNKYEGKENQLRRKILSVGRKIINRKGFNSTAFLRFLKYKNLGMVWLPKSELTANIDSNFVKILTRMKNTDNDDKDVGWVDYCPAVDSDTQPLVNKDYVPADEMGNVPLVNKDYVPADEMGNVSDRENIQLTQITDRAVLYSISASDSKKILNANPVANPKQLPKKIEKLNTNHNLKIVTKNKDQIKTQFIVAEYGPGVFLHPKEDNNVGMPIITSTTSLAVINADETREKKATPRIKIKPLAELMSKESLTRMNMPPKSSVLANSNNQAISNTQASSNPLMINKIPISATPSNVTKSDNSNKNKEYVILDSLDLPNRKTSSPYDYFKILLHMHGLVLLDTHVCLSKDFTCLIKFQVLFKQDSKDNPVKLNISLHCFGKVFCIKITDHNQDIDVSKISANWQWEILKLFKDDVVNKMLQTAQKVSSEVASNTLKFINLYKSVKLVKPVKEIC